MVQGEDNYRVHYYLDQPSRGPRRVVLFCRICRLAKNAKGR